MAVKSRALARSTGTAGVGRSAGSGRTVEAEDARALTCPGNSRLADGPLIVQSDKTVLLEVDHPQAREARAALAPFAELERAPEHIHTYRVTPLALWNARAAGHDAEQEAPEPAAGAS